MSAQVERESAPPAVNLSPLGSPREVTPPLLDPDFDGGHRLPSDHPAWARDVVSLSARARALVAHLRPIVVKVVAAWEHRVRSILVGGRRLSVDPVGCYRLD